MATNMFVSGFSPPYMLRVSTKTWMRDSHDLFDYETSQQVNVSHFAVSCGLKLLRDDALVSAIEYNNVVEKEHDHLLSVICKRTGEYVVMPAEKVPGSLLYPQKLWLIVRTLPYQRYALQENDVIKLGRFRLRVKQLVPGPVETPNSASAANSCSHVKKCPGAHSYECPYYGNAASHNLGCNVAQCSNCSNQDPKNGQNSRNPNSKECNDEQLVKLFDGVIPEKTITFEEQCNMQCRICLAEGYLHNPLSSSDNAGTPLHSSKETSLDTASDKDLSGHYINSDLLSSGNTTMSPENGDLCGLTPSASSFDSDRLICACECKGSIKYVHVDCLRKWIDSRWNLKADEPLPSMVFIREVSCELCKTNYPCYIRQNGELIQIVKMPKMSVPFLVLENITPHAIKGVHLLSMKDMKDLKLGRGHESDVRIPDVSISRYHATIRYEAGQFYLEDHDSKFGTLVAMRKPKMVSHKEPLSVQVGRSVINLSIDESLPYVQNRIMTLSTSSGTVGVNNAGLNSGSNSANPNVSSNSVGNQSGMYRNVESGSNMGLTSSGMHNSFTTGMTLTSTGEVDNNYMGLNTRFRPTNFGPVAQNFTNDAINYFANGFSNNFVNGTNNFSNESNTFSNGSNNFNNDSNNFSNDSNTFSSGTGYTSSDVNNSYGVYPAFSTMEYENALNSSRYLSFLQTAYSTVMNSTPNTPMSTSPASAMNTSPNSNVNNLNTNAVSNTNTPTSMMSTGNTPTNVMSRGSNMTSSASNPGVGATSSHGSASGLGLINAEVSGNIIATNAGRNNVVTTVSASPRTPTNAVPVVGSAASSASGITDLYWNYMRNTVRPRLDSDILDGLGNPRLNSFRINPHTSNSAGVSAAPANPSLNVPANSVSTSPSIAASVGFNQSVATGEDIEMLLPESVFIANWNAIPTRNVDLNVDTGTSSLEHRHSNQELDKPMSRL